MTDGRDHIAAYHRDAERLVAEYESLDPSTYRDTFRQLLPPGDGRLALDVGAGSGRDAGWLRGLGFDVVAVEPAEGMRLAGMKTHRDAGIRWLDDRLPSLDATHAIGLSFDVVLLSAVWQHVGPGDRPRAFRKLITLLRPGGLLVITLRFGPSPANRPMHPVSQEEMEALAREHGLAVVSIASHAGDARRRPGVEWTTMCMTLPDDGSGALPLLRGIILNDNKSATYKLALLRAVARIADLSPALARQRPDGDAVDLPLGAVALNWIRMYLPLVSRGLPQAPGNAGPDGLGFAKAGFRVLLEGGFSPLDLRIGSAFAGDRGAAVAAALREASRLIAAMPANFTRYPNSPDRVFNAAPAAGVRGGGIALDAETLAAFGTLTVPGHVWRTMQRLGTWVEPVLVAEWARLTEGYMERMGAVSAPGTVAAALAWIEPMRDVRVARDAALGRMADGAAVRCVWSDRSLQPSVLDVDHCLPWSAWACGDLWNLMPAHRRVNQREKRGLLPSSAALAGSREAIVDWWRRAWLADAALEARFRREVEAALPVASDATVEAAFDGLAWRRLRLQQDQRLSEWAGCIR